MPEEQDEAPPFIDNNLLGKSAIVNENPFEVAKDNNTTPKGSYLIGRSSLLSNGSTDNKTR